MAAENDRDQSGKESQRTDAGKSAGREHTFGRGMTSPDSTEAVLDASTGEPDPRARGGEGGGKTSRSGEDQDLEQDV